MSKKSKKVGVRIIKQSNFDEYKDVIKSDKTEQIDMAANIASGEWIPQPIDMRGLEAMVQHSTILPQCIRAYKSNIAGFGISVQYAEDIDETDSTVDEWDSLAKILDLLNLDYDTKEVFEQVIESREKYGIAYVECIRNIENQLVGIEFISDTPSVEMTYPLIPYIDMEYSYKGELVSRRRKFRKFRQTIAGKTVYFKEFGDPRVMDKRSGEYVKDGELLELDYQANEILDFKVGDGYYGTVRWIGTTLTIDGCHRAERLNNNYFRNGRHVPLMIIVRGGTLSDESWTKLQEYMDEIKGEKGQHAFMVLEAEKNETTTDFTADNNQPGIEIKDMAAILQNDELFQQYQENGRKKVQSAFLLPDLYVGYTTDFNRATAQVAMENTEKQVFQPERKSLAWQINNKLLNGYGFKYVEAFFNAPDITNPDDIMKILNISERAGGMTLNEAHELTKNVLGLEAEDYPEEFDMSDIGNIPLAVIKSMSAMYNYGSRSITEPTEAYQNTEGDRNKTIDEQLDEQINKAASNSDDEVVAIMKEVRRLLKQQIGGDDNEDN